MSININKHIDIIGNEPNRVTIIPEAAVPNGTLNTIFQYSSESMNAMASAIGGDTPYTNVSQSLVMGDVTLLASGVSSGTSISEYLSNEAIDIGSMETPLALGSGFINHISNDFATDNFDVAPTRYVSHSDAIDFIEEKFFQISGIDPASQITNTTLVKPFRLIAPLDLIDASDLDIAPMSGVIGSQYAYASGVISAYPSGTIASRLALDEYQLGSPYNYINYIPDSGILATDPDLIRGTWQTPGSEVDMAGVFVACLNKGGFHDTWSNSGDAPGMASGRWFTLTLKKGTKEVEIEMWGAGGGAATYVDYYSTSNNAQLAGPATGGSGGSGGYIRFRYTLTPADNHRLYFYIGAAGATGVVAKTDWDGNQDAGGNIRYGGAGGSGEETKFSILSPVDNPTNIRARAYGGGGGQAGYVKMVAVPLARYVICKGGIKGNKAANSFYDPSIAPLTLSGGLDGGAGNPLVETGTFGSVNNANKFYLGAYGAASLVTQSSFYNISIPSSVSSGSNMGRGGSSSTVYVDTIGFSSNHVVVDSSTLLPYARPAFPGRVVVKEVAYTPVGDPNWAGWL